MQRFFRHLRHALWIWHCNVYPSSRAYWGWIKFGTAWEATRHVSTDPAEWPEWANVRQFPQPHPGEETGASRWRPEHDEEWEVVPKPEDWTQERYDEVRPMRHKGVKK
jgi:hypothetical protein